jgi:hypothetical protein
MFGIEPEWRFVAERADETQADGKIFNLSSPFRGRAQRNGHNPGRCPGLKNRSPSGCSFFEYQSLIDNRFLNAPARTLRIHPSLATLAADVSSNPSSRSHA